MECGNLAVTNLRRLGEVGARLRVLGLNTKRFKLFLRLLNAGERLFFVFPFELYLPRFLFEVGNFSFNLLDARLGISFELRHIVILVRTYEINSPMRDPFDHVRFFAE